MPELDVIAYAGVPLSAEHFPSFPSSHLGPPISVLAQTCQHSHMITEAKLLAAVRNNALWCDAICRAHGVLGEFHEAYWINHGNVPPYTSKLITLAGGERAREQLAAIESLIETEPETFSVKDSFQCLNFALLGFGVLFHATWIFWTPGTKLPMDPAEQLKWSVVQGRDELGRWESAWRGDAANVAVDGRAAVFLPGLLEESGLHFLAGKSGGAIVASAALNRTGDVVGLSNVFSAVRNVGPLYPGCVRTAQELYPGTPIVSYARGDDLVAAEKAGFTRIHGLTVWQRAVA
jgi:hypothetical protein